MLLLVGVSACSLSGTGRDNPFSPGNTRRLSVVIENRNTRTVEVELLAPGRRMSLGRVPGGGRIGITIPWTQTRDVSFRIDPLIGATHTTPAVRTEPGDTLELWVQDPVELSIIRR